MNAPAPARIYNQFHDARLDGDDDLKALAKKAVDAFAAETRTMKPVPFLPVAMLILAEEIVQRLCKTNLRDLEDIERSLHLINAMSIYGYGGSSRMLH